MAKTTSKLRGPYAPQACGVCRSRKSKCDGVKPTCGSCRGSGRDSECSWGHISLRRPRTAAHFDALRRRADSLQAYADMLQGLLAKCVCQDVPSHLPCPPPSSGDHSWNDPSSEDDATHSDEDFAHELTRTAPAQCPQRVEDPNTLVHPPIPAVPVSSAPPIRLPQCLGMNEGAGLNERPSASYILLVEGVEEAQSYVDWSRYLPAEVTLTRKEHDKILDLSFKFFTMWCMRITPALFLRDMHRALSVPQSDIPPRTAYYSPALQNVLLALSGSFSDDPYIKHLETRLIFASTAKAHLEREYEWPSPSLVQTLAFLGTFYADADHRILGDSFFAMSNGVNMALDLGPNAAESVKTGLITREEMLTQNSAHWSTFIVDVLCALHFRRPLTRPPPDRQNIPVPIDKESDQIPWTHPSTTMRPQPNLLTLIFSEAAGLLLIAYQTIDVMNLSPSAQLDAVQIDERVTKIDLELNKWLSRLPPEIDITFMNRSESTPQRLMLHCCYSWCCIVLHRPFFGQRGELQDDHIKRSMRAAENILELLQTWSETYTLRLAPLGLVPFVFDAGTIFLLRALHATTGQRIAHTALQTAIDQVETCVRHLKEIGRTWQTAERTAVHLQSMLRDKLQPILDQRISPNGGRLRSDIRGASAKSDRGSNSPSLHFDRGGPGQYAEMPPLISMPTLDLPSTESGPPNFIAGNGYGGGVGSSCLPGSDVDMSHVLFPSVEFFNHHQLPELASSSTNPTYNYY